MMTTSFKGESKLILLFLLMLLIAFHTFVIIAPHCGLACLSQRNRNMYTTSKNDDPLYQVLMISYHIPCSRFSLNLFEKSWSCQRNHDIHIRHHYFYYVNKPFLTELDILLFFKDRKTLFVHFCDKTDDFIMKK